MERDTSGSMDVGYTRCGSRQIDMVATGTGRRA
jgi:hypothetical protein